MTGLDPFVVKAFRRKFSNKNTVRGARLYPAVVAAVNPTGAADGSPLVTVNLNGSVFAAMWLAPLGMNPPPTPLVGAAVYVSVDHSVPVIVGALYGPPPTQ